MKKSKIIVSSLVTALTVIPVLTGCGKDKFERMDFAFSVDIESGKNEIEMGSHEKLVVLDNGADDWNKDDVARKYKFATSNPAVATINNQGIITPVSEGEVTFQVTEETSTKKVSLVNPVKIVAQADKKNGGENYSAQAGEEALKTRTEILSKLEKYAMDSHLTGITLFDNGGYVKYNRDRVDLPTTNYITGYGFGLLREGNIVSDMEKETNPDYKRYYHTSLAQDSMSINAMNASGSQVSDLSSYITSAYWGTKMADNKKNYEWYPVLAKDSIKKPIVDEETGEVTGFEETETPNTRPIAIEPKNDLNLYKKWRIYVKTGEGLKYTTAPGHREEFNGRQVALADYEFIYKFLLTGKNAQSRGAEMAGDTTYGIKGAQKFYNSTISAKNQTAVDNLWNQMKLPDEDGEVPLGIKTGSDIAGDYIELELVNAIDEFTAMYTLSSSLCSPIPEAFMKKIGEDAGAEEAIFKAGERYGNFNDKDILDYVINLGPYKLTRWDKKQLIVFSRNDDWFEVKNGFYKIPGIHNRVIDTSTDTEANYKQFNDGMLDVCGIPISKIDIERTAKGVYQTKGDSTFKLNVNSCNEEQWNTLFGPNGKINKNSSWDLKPWMSNSNFLNGLFFSINRQEFADKRGVQPSINYFSDAYLSDPEKGTSYNASPEHEEAVSAYHTVRKDESGKVIYDNYGYDYTKAVNSFKTAVNQLKKSGKVQLGESKKKPNTIGITICWMYPTDPTEYGEDIASYFEKAFNDDAVCGGRLKLKVTNTYVTNWEDVYNEKMMKGQFDLGFGAISGNTYNPLNFLEVLRTDNSSSFTLNWGADTALVDPVHPIIYKGNKYSFDALWEVADHGGIVQEGQAVKPVVKCYQENAHMINTSDEVTGKEINGLGGYDKGVAIEDFNGYEIRIPLEFVDTDNVQLEFSRLDVYASGVGNVRIKGAYYDEASKCVVGRVSKAVCEQIDQGMFESLFRDDGSDLTKEENIWKLHPFLANKYNDLWNYEVYYKMTLAGGQPTENYAPVKINALAKD